MRLIDADALEREGWSLCRTFQKDKNTMVYELKKPSDFPIIEERKTGKMSELKPCPFCGGKATPVYCENGSQYTSNMLYLSKRGTVKCTKCEIRLPRIYSRVSKAIEAWNSREEP